MRRVGWVPAAVAFSETTFGSVTRRYRCRDFNEFVVEKVVMVGEDIVDHAAKQIQSLVQAYGRPDDFNVKDRKTTEFVSAIVVAACRTLQNMGMRVSVEHAREVDGNEDQAHGFLDFVFEVVIGEFTFLVTLTEAKATEMPKGVAQNIMQLEVMNDPSQGENPFSLEHLYGVVSTGADWRVVRYPRQTDIRTAPVPPKVSRQFRIDVADGGNLAAQVREAIEVVASAVVHQSREAEAAIALRATAVPMPAGVAATTAAIDAATVVRRPDDEGRARVRQKLKDAQNTLSDACAHFDGFEELYSRFQDITREISELAGTLGKVYQAEPEMRVRR